MRQNNVESVRVPASLAGAPVRRFHHSWAASRDHRQPSLGKLPAHTPPQFVVRMSRLESRRPEDGYRRSELVQAAEPVLELPHDSFQSGLLPVERPPPHQKAALTMCGLRLVKVQLVGSETGFLPVGSPCALQLVGGLGLIDFVRCQIHLGSSPAISSSLLRRRLKDPGAALSCQQITEDYLEGRTVLTNSRVHSTARAWAADRAVHGHPQVSRGKIRLLSRRSSPADTKRVPPSLGQTRD